MKNIKVIEKRGDLPGKNIAILVGVHGNETPGIVAIKKLIPKLKILKGKVFFIYCNLIAIKQNKRFIDFNLNRSFMRKQNRKMDLEGRTAKEIMKILDKCDSSLDIHSSNTKKSLPFIICNKKSFDLAKVIPFKKVSYNWEKYEKGSSESYMYSRNRNALSIECGYINDKKSISNAEKAIIAFLRYYNMINGKNLNYKKDYIKIVKLYKNKLGPFKVFKEFKDFEKLNKKTLIGHDGKKAIFIKSGNLILFARNREKIGEECFLVAKNK